MSALELGRLFSLMEGVDPEGLFTAALRMSTGAGGGGMLDAALGGTGGLTPALAGMEGLPASQMEDGGLKSGVERSGGGGDADEGAASTDGDSRGSVGGTGGAPGGPAVPPRTGAINDCKCTKVGWPCCGAGERGWCAQVVTHLRCPDTWRAPGQPPRACPVQPSRGFRASGAAGPPLPTLPSTARALDAAPRRTLRAVHGASRRPDLTIPLALAPPRRCCPPPLLRPSTSL